MMDVLDIAKLWHTSVDDEHFTEVREVAEALITYYQKGRKQQEVLQVIQNAPENIWREAHEYLAALTDGQWDFDGYDCSDF